MRMISRFMLGAATLLFAVSFLVAPQPASAQGNLDPWGSDTWQGDLPEGQDASDVIQGTTGLGGEDPRAIAASVINVILGFLGIIAVILILAGGFIWMTAAGNEDKVAQAKKVMSAGVIGLVIVLAAFGIAQFVVNALVDATTGS